MLRTFDIILIGLMIAAAGITYKIKHDAEKQMTEVHKIQRMIADEKDTIDLLKADWSLLTQPNRLQKLVSSFQGQLNLQPVEAQQIANINEIPKAKPAAEKIDDVANLITEADAGPAVKKTDTMKTGSVRRATVAAVPGAKPKGAAH
ncbi:cell division protein FtsL [Phyllobacterium sp. 22229]|uniref:Cell division protein FtsL n=1 Tax=Phyllobacterium myrsinacearum TaxID=28101 RepID=A0A2S9JX91_9HYPH|nr:hypothetical protein [Phyllobacterium myrsinacearum]PRD57949.1 hypothetical protein C5750_02015 [Phyllobacterium myrsinacearum]PWV96124.1 hypothetical protein DEV92_101101 [Phyllobacterium myrsinacearum]RZS83406.1 hypothetical protein EV217_2149 [Phyllobacterium myrsinacearum]RZV09886.1 hypothetical protein EV654_0987 [Phyllobacterium myrsinacearum]